MQVNRALGRDEEVDVAAGSRSWPYLTPCGTGWSWGGRIAGWAPGIPSHLREGIEGWLSAHAPDDPSPTGVVLQALERARRYREAIDEEIRLLVAEAHVRGASWAEIADSLDCSRQSAHERYRSFVHSQGLYARLESDVISALDYANDVSLSKDTPESEAEEALVFLEASDRRFDWLSD